MCAYTHTYVFKDKKEKKHEGGEGKINILYMKTRNEWQKK